MRKSCAQSVYSALASCARTHHLYARSHALPGWRGYYPAVIPRLVRMQRDLFYTAPNPHSVSVASWLFPTIHMTNNNYNFVYIKYLVVHSYTEGVSDI
jgi:hypothetical protein